MIATVTTRRLLGVVILVFLLSCTTAFAQETSERVTVTAADGLVMVGDFYRAPNEAEPLPALLLLHGVGGTRTEWMPLIPLLLDAGYHVLAVDQRGFGETGGTRNLATMIDDVQPWLDWLRDQPGVAPVTATIGISMGAVPALGGCAVDDACTTAILISPGDFPLLNEAVYEALSERSVLFIVGRNDNVLYDTRRMFERTVGEAALHIYNTSLHGTGLLLEQSSYHESITQLILLWLRDHLPQQPS